ncbi:MAG: hypothetical protein U0136_03640 [Bdellovibrionota bacterium]
MYINRTERIERPLERLRRTPRSGGESFASTMESVIEMDVVEIGHSTDDQPKRQTPERRQRQEEAESESAEPHTLDIKV